MAWMRTIAGRLKSDYSYGVQTVYNTFTWCELRPAQKKSIEQSAQKILEVRKKYPEATLADLYDELSMPADLREAHKKNDRAVTAAYGLEKYLDEE